MKKHISYSVLAALLFIALNGFASADIELSDKIDKTFKVNVETLLSVRNSFGKVEVTNWDKNEFHVVVDIIVEANNEAKAQKLMDAIDVTYNESGQSVYFKTSLSKMNNNGSASFEINYTIKMPATNPIEIKNSFGDVYLSEREGRADLDVSYGALKAESLLGDNVVALAFGKGYFDRFANGQIAIKYSDVEITSSQTLEMNTQFSKVELEKVDRLALKAKYGSVELGHVGDIEADASFNGLTIETLSGSLRLDASYVSGFEIDEVKPSFQIIDIKGKFSSFEINLASDVAANFDAKFKFSDLKDTGVNIDYSYRVKDHNENEYRGTINGGDSNKRILIDSSYGNCKLYQ
jgi:hypothetical protein